MTTRISHRYRALVLRTGRLRVAAVVIILTALASAPAEAQTVRGRVLDAATGTPIHQATVALLQDGRTVTGSLTDAEGHFTVTLEVPGTYLLRTSAQGYLTADSPDTRVGIGFVQMGDIRLRPNPVALDEILVEVRRGRVSGQERVRQRQLLGEGTFVAGALLAIERPPSLTAYLAEIADLHVRIDRWGFPYLWSPVGPYHCLVVQVNHWPLATLGYRSLDEIAYPRIAAIEIYNTAADVPPEPQLLADIENPRNCPCGRCGLVNVWYWGSW